jgi:hypothetical protein
MKRVILLLLLAAGAVFAQSSYSEIGWFEPMQGGSSDWGDYDNDGDLDLLVTGGLGMYTRLYRNDGFYTFSYVDAGLLDVAMGDGKWGDFDNDGLLDILIAGDTDPGNFAGTVRIYRNNGNETFTDVTGDLAFMLWCSADWGDFDNDGDLDFAVNGGDPVPNVKIFRNNSGTFELAHSMQGGSEGSVEWGDYDNDGDLDLLVTGCRDMMMMDYRAILYINDGNSFLEVPEPVTGLKGIRDGEAAWGDYDNDGDLDILISGVMLDQNFMTDAPFTAVYRNDGSGIFTDINAPLMNLQNSSVAWGDCDLDGYLDAVVCGNTGTGDITKIYKFNGAVFQDVFAPVMDVSNSDISLANIDGDWDLDLFVGGTGSSSLLYVCDPLIVQPRIPTTPENASVAVLGRIVNMDWTSLSGIDERSFNVHVEVNGNILVPSMSDSTGYRRTVSVGNAGLTPEYNMVLPEPLPLLPQQGSRYVEFKVQAINNCYTGSGFAAADTLFTSNDLRVDSAPVMLPEDNLYWEYMIPDSIAYYKIEVSTDSAFSQAFQDSVLINSKKVVTNTKGVYFGVALNEFSIVDSLLHNQEYFWRVKPVYSNPYRLAHYTQNDDVLSFIFDPVDPPDQAPNPPVSGFTPAEGVTIEDTTPMLFWDHAFDPDNVAEELRYILIVSPYISLFNPVFTDTTAAGITYSQVDAVLESGMEYYYKIKTVDPENLESAWSATQNFNTLTLYPPERPMSGFSPGDGDVISDTTPFISWDPAFDPDDGPENLRYYFDLYQDSTFTLNVFRDTTFFGAASIQVTTKLQKGHKYWYWVNTLDDDNQSSWAATLQSFYIDSLHHPNPPVSGFNPANDDITDSTPLISWGNASDPDGNAQDLHYIIELDSLNTFTSVVFSDTTSAGITYFQVAPALPDGFRYYYRIKTIDADSLESDWSATQQFITLMPPQSVKISSDGLNVIVDWDDIPIGTKGVVYTVYGSDDPYSGFAPVAVQLTQSEWTTRISDSKKFYRVTAGSSSKEDQEDQ